MDDTTGLQEAAQTLLDHFGPRLETGRAEGRRLMAEVLEQKLGISSHDAKELVEALEQAHTIRWIAGGEQGGTEPAVIPIVPGVIERQTGRVVAGVPFQGGYWQLGA